MHASIQRALFEGEGAPQSRSRGEQLAADAHGIVAAAYERLFVRENAPDEVVKSAFRVLARSAHPDAGGDLEEMKRLNLTWDRITEWWKLRDQMQQRRPA